MTVVFIGALVILSIAYFVFRRLISHDYLVKGHLTILSSFSELAAFGGIMAFPNLYLPVKWSHFWRFDGPSGFPLHLTGFIITLIGIAGSFGTMGWFGLRRAFGAGAADLVRRGPYRLTRNPQILGGYLMIVGIAVQHPSWYSLLWIALYGISGHWMILSEEEYLRKSLGEQYEEFCRQTPRYFFRTGK